VKNKLIDCITFFQENFIFNLRYNILKNIIDEFIVCESIYDHRGKKKKLNFNKKFQKIRNIKYLVYKKKFPKNNSAWQNQALQREFILQNLSHLQENDLIFFSDPDEIPNPKILRKINLKKKYGIFLQQTFNYKFNIYNNFESPWEGTRVCKKKNLKSIDYMRQKVLTKNLNYPFWRIDKETEIEIFKNGGWHFNNIMSEKEISIKLKSFAHIEFSDKSYSSINVIKSKIKNLEDLFNRNHTYKKIKLEKFYPEFILKEVKKHRKFIN
jgi:beta-1,4-mannosyl-glycoprotein beta-1,4-N-acetylglucosaminyltransferase